MRFLDAQVDTDLGVIFSAIDINSALVSGIAGTITYELRDEDGAAAESVVITEQGSSGFYEAHFTPTQSRSTGYLYFLRITLPAATTDGAILEYPIRVYPNIAVSGVTGSFLTTLANVKAVEPITVNTYDTLLTSLIARITALIESRLDGRIIEASYQEIRDGNGRSVILPRQRPVTTLTAVYVSDEQTWDATTQIDAASLLLDGATPRIYHRNGVFTSGFQNVRIDYTAGYSTIPHDVEHYAIEKVLAWFRARKTLGVTSISLKDGSVTKAATAVKMFSDVDDRLGKYLRRRVA